jgi:hypothetical protein
MERVRRKEMSLSISLGESEIENKKIKSLGHFEHNRDLTMCMSPFHYFEVSHVRLSHGSSLQFIS